MSHLILPPLTLYIHIPWCVEKCPYCDFNSHAVITAPPQSVYVDALLTDFEHESVLIQERVIESIFIGGGTPSLFSGEAIQELINGIRSRCELSHNCEITLEANPGTTDAEHFAAYREAGINRLSIGIQSFDNDALKQLGRIHNRDEAIDAFNTARSCGFDNINLDLMFGLPGQTLDCGRTDIEAAVSLGPEHLSYYQLTLEPNTHFHHSPPELPDEELIIDIHEQGQALLDKLGYSQYEVSGYAQPGHQCHHNLNYWHFGDYIGIGAGAHGKITHLAQNRIERRRKCRHPNEYLQQSPYQRTHSDQLKPADLKLEFMLNGLRLNAGVKKELFAQRTGLSYDDIEGVIQEAVAKGWLNADDHLTPTENGRRFLNDLLSLFIDE